MLLIVCRLKVFVFGLIYSMKSENILMIIAINIKRKRADIGISQEELADLSGLHRTYISAVERSGRNISIINLEKIAKALGVNLADLVSYEEVDGEL